MNIEFEVCNSLCEMAEFIINGVEADAYDFGNKSDISPETAEDYGCGNMTFVRRPSTTYVLEKYGITEEEYSDVCERLEQGLSFGCCGWCV